MAQQLHVNMPKPVNSVVCDLANSSMPEFSSIEIPLAQTLLSQGVTMSPQMLETFLNPTSSMQSFTPENESYAAKPVYSLQQWQARELAQQQMALSSS